MGDDSREEKSREKASSLSFFLSISLAPPKPHQTAPSGLRLPSKSLE